MTAIRCRMARADAQRRAMGKLQLDDAVTPSNGLPMHRLDRDGGQRSVIDAVDEIADLQLSDSSIADGRRDRCSRRRAVASRTARGAGSVDRLEASGDGRTDGHRAAELRAAAALSSATRRALAARCAQERARPSVLARSVRTIGMLARTCVPACSAVDDVVAGIDAETAAAFESLAVAVTLTRLATAGPAGSPAAAAAASGCSAAGRSARAAAASRSTAGAATRCRTESRRDVHAARTLRRPATDLLDGADLPAAVSGCSARTAAATTRARTTRAASRAAPSAVRSARAGHSARSAEGTADSAAATRARASTGSTFGLTAGATARSAAVPTRIGSTGLNGAACGQRADGEHDQHERGEFHRGPFSIA
jgi:hypothetical protein